MKKTIYISIVIIIIIFIILWFRYRNCVNSQLTPNGQKPLGCNFITGKPNSTKPGSGNTGSGIYGTGVNSTTTLPPGPKTLNDFVGKPITATYDGIKLYNNDLSVAATYNKGDYIGWLGGEAKGYVCCKNQANFYKIYDNSNTTGLCNCEPLLSDETLKIIFGI